jgi:DNA-binding SARP family transcriptional activator
VSVEVTLLGPPAVRRDGAHAAFDTRKAIALLAELAMAERARPRETLCELLWPEHDPERARGALRRTLSTLRKAIGEEWLEVAGDTVGLRRGPGLELDVFRFRELARADASIEDLTKAARLFRGDFLEGFGVRGSAPFEHWQREQAEALRRELASALRRLVVALAEGGDVEAAIPYAQRWLELDPVHEPTHRELIRLYALSGDRGAALSQYRDCVRVLSQELGVSPVDETALLFEQVSEGELAPTAPGPAEPPQPEREGLLELPFVGRSAELRVLLQALKAAGDGGRLAVVEGEAGIGKTRLVSELLAAAVEAGAPVAAARCHDASPGTPYAPIVELLSQRLADGEEWVEAVAPQRLADASLLLPELAGLRPDLPAPLSVSGPVAQARLLEGIAAVLGAKGAGQTPGVIFVDDVHAADQATLGVLSYLLQRLDGLSNLLVVSWRSEQLAPGHRLRRAAGELARARTASIVRLARLDEERVVELVSAARADVAPETARRIYVDSEGLPLFVAEYLAAMPHGDERPPALPGEVRTVLEARLDGLGEIPRQLLGAAAVLGPSFGFDPVRATSGRGHEETVEALEDLTARGLVREVPGADPTFEFSHQKLRELIYEEQVSLPRRRLLHLRAARAMPEVPSSAAIAARHLREAGELADAAERYRAAAAHAESLHAHADALDYLQAALACGAADGADLQERIGDLQTLLGRYAEALASYERAAAEADGAALAAIEQKLATVHHRRGEWERSEARLAAALAAVPTDAPGLRARIMADLALTLHRSGKPDEALERAAEARTIADRAHDPRAMAQAHNLLGMLAHSRGELDAAAAELARSLELAEELGEEPARVAALNNLALVARDAGDLDRALSLTGSALELCAAYGDRHRQAALENNIADLHHAAGRAGEAMAHLKEAVTIFAEIGAHEATRLPEIWKLVSW